MGKIALVFAGQGAQYPGMGKSLYEVSAAARAVFDLAERLRPGTLTQCFEGTKEELTVTRNTQPCLYCVDLAAACALREAGGAPAAPPHRPAPGPHALSPRRAVCSFPETPSLPSAPWPFPRYAPCIQPLLQKQPTFFQLPCKIPLTERNVRVTMN